MAFCINKNNVEYQTLAQRSGIPTSILDATCSVYLEKYNRFPHLDELPRSNSTPYLKDNLKLDDRNVTSIDNILDYTKKESIEESIVYLNTEFKDVEVDILPIGYQAIVNIQKRPSLFEINSTEEQVQDSNINSVALFNQQLAALAKLYGIKFIPITNQELTQDEWKPIVASAINTKAFVYNNDIYINTNNCSVDSPLHEMLHIFLGSMRFTNPELYTKLVNSAENFPGYKFKASKFPNRTKLDVNEEIFIEEFSKYLTNRSSLLFNLPANIKYEIFYNMNRVIDTLLFGEYSVKGVNNLYDFTLRDLSKKLNSRLLNNSYSGTLNVKDASVHRLLANKKSALMESNELKEYC